MTGTAWQIKFGWWNQGQSCGYATWYT